LAALLSRDEERSVRSCARTPHNYGFLSEMNWESKRSHEQIAWALPVSKGASTKRLNLANAAGPVGEAEREFDERALLAQLLQRSTGLAHIHVAVGGIHCQAGTSTHERARSCVLSGARYKVSRLVQDGKAATIGMKTRHMLAAGGGWRKLFVAHVEP
jgi:hypothetical protein